MTIFLIYDVSQSICIPSRILPLNVITVSPNFAQAAVLARTYWYQLNISKTVFSERIIDQATNMADDDQSAWTRVQREAALKDLCTVFDKHVRSLNKVARKTQVYLSSDSIDISTAQGFSQQYESVVENISEVFERIVDLSLGSSPEKLEADFKSIDSESSKFLCDVRVQIQQFRSREE